MTRSSPQRPDRVRVTTFVAVEPERAFEIFTREIELWWKSGPRFGTPPRFEGSRLVAGHGDELFEIGRVLVWETGARLVFEWRARNFAPGELTEVEVRFEPTGAGTRVTLEHRGWAALRGDHPARHGLEGEAFTAMIGLWWGELATTLRAHVARGTDGTRR